MVSYVFDFDGTLVRNRAFRFALERLPRELNLDFGGEVFRILFMETYYRLVAHGKIREAFDWDYVAKITVECQGYRYTRGLFDELFFEGLNRGLIETINDSSEALKRIKEIGARVVVLTNGYSRYQIPALERSGLEDLVDVMYTIDLLPKPKPYREAFEYVINRERPKVYVGDHIYYDIYGASQTNIPRIYWVSQNKEPGVYTMGALRRILEEKARRYGARIDGLDLNRKIVVIRSLLELLSYEL